jgi:hypothetical protein
MSAKEPKVPSLPGRNSDRKLPNPELNPLLNQTLGRNLGRWAEVYVTNPPEKREEAVGELLRELHAQNVSNTSTGSDEQRIPIEPAPNGRTPTTPPGTEAVACSKCHHRNLPDQLFCGMCGSGLKDPVAPSVAPESFVLPSSPLLAGEGSASKASSDDRVDMEWLREKSLRGFEAEEEQRRRPLRVLLAFVVAMLFFGFFYMEWQSRSNSPAYRGPSVNVRRSTAPQAQPPTSSPQAASPATLAGNASAKASLAPERAVQSSTAPTPENSSPVQAPSSSPTRPPRDVSAGSNGIPDTASDNGAGDVAQAENYLQGKATRRSSAEAAKYLWRAVGKKNSTALVLLADLYERGDGVAKSCDQAKLLLIAAAKKGSAAAGQKLRNLQSSGCR